MINVIVAEPKFSTAIISLTPGADPGKVSVWVIFVVNYNPSFGS